MDVSEQEQALTDWLNYYETGELSFTVMDTKPEDMPTRYQVLLMLITEHYFRWRNKLPADRPNNSAAQNAQQYEQKAAEIKDWYLLEMFLQRAANEWARAYAVPRPLLFVKFC